MNIRKMNQTLLPSSVIPKDLNTITYKELHFPIMLFTYFPFTFQTYRLLATIARGIAQQSRGAI